MDTLKELVSKHNFTRNGMRTNLDNNPDNWVMDKGPCALRGTEYREKEVWHGPYQGDQVTHWARGHSTGTRYSCVVFHGPPARSTRRATRPEMRGSIPDDKTA